MSTSSETFARIAEYCDGHAAEAARKHQLSQIARDGQCPELAVKLQGGAADSAAYALALRLLMLEGNA